MHFLIFLPGVHIADSDTFEDDTIYCLIFFMNDSLKWLTMQKCRLVFNLTFYPLDAIIKVLKCNLIQEISNFYSANSQRI